MFDLETHAKIEHEIWSHWMRYLFEVSYNQRDDGCVVIPAEQVKRWKRQMDTPYAELTEREKESDREQARKHTGLSSPNSDENSLITAETAKND